MSPLLMSKLNLIVSGFRYSKMHSILYLTVLTVLAFCLVMEVEASPYLISPQEIDELNLYEIVGPAVGENGKPKEISSVVPFQPFKCRKGKVWSSYCQCCRRIFRG